MIMERDVLLKRSCINYCNFCCISPGFPPQEVSNVIFLTYFDVMFCQLYKIL